LKLSAVIVSMLGVLIDIAVILDMFPSKGLVQFVKKKGAKMIEPRLSKLSSEVKEVAYEGKMKVL
jgi:hypothetical protein